MNVPFEWQQHFPPLAGAVLGQPKVWNTVTLIAEKLSRCGIIREQELNHIVGVSNLPEKQTLLDFRT
jgi:hypothetical protein